MTSGDNTQRISKPTSNQIENQAKLQYENQESPAFSEMMFCSEYTYSDLSKTYLTSLCLLMKKDQALPLFLIYDFLTSCKTEKNDKSL